MQLGERLDSAQFRKDLSALRGMRIGRVWLGYADVLFLECGRLKKERVRPVSMPPSPSLEGQVTFMLHCGWRVENRYSVAYGIGSGSRKLCRQVQKMKGCRIESVEATGRVPELTIALDNGQVIRTFQDFGGSPGWSIGFRDLALIDMRPEWRLNDVSVWFCFQDKSFMRQYCFDEATFSPRKFLRQYGV